MVSAGGKEEEQKKIHHDLEVFAKRKKETGIVSMIDSAFFRC